MTTIYRLLSILLTLHFSLNWASIHSSSSQNSINVAVCIGGQAARWQPQHLFDGLLFPNLPDHYSFHLFFNIQTKSEVIFNTDNSNSFTPSLIASMETEEAKKYLNALAYDSTQITIASLQYTQMVSKEALLSYFNATALDRITQYTEVQVTILNMYAHQVRCIQQILDYERKHSFQFDYIVSTREDVFFFRPLNLTAIIAKLRKDLSPEAFLSIPTEKLKPSTFPVCDIVYKRCLYFWGFNMRLYILKREVGIQFLGNRFSFYKYLYQINRTVENPERFELSMANALHFFGCPVSVEDYPVTAVRHYYNGQLCFVFFEIDRCVPRAFQDFAKQYLCLEQRRQFFLDKIYSELPELLKADFVTGVGNISLTQVHKVIRRNLDIQQLQRYYRTVLSELSSPQEYSNRTKIKEILEKNYQKKKKGLPKTLQRITADPVLVGLTWIDRDF